MQITQCLHTAVLVSNLESAENFYGKVLGLSKIDRLLKYPGAWYQIGNYQIHLIVDESIHQQVHNYEKLGRNRHIAFAVADLDAAKEQLVSHGCQIQMSASGRAAIFTYDPDGNVVELNAG